MYAKKLEIITKEVTYMIDIEPTSSGEVLQEEFLGPMNVTAYRLAKEVNIPQSRISDIIRHCTEITS